MRVLLHGLGLLFAAAFTQFSGCTVVFNNNGNVQSVAITPAGPTIPVGGKQQFVANVTFGDGALITVKLSDVLWSTSDPKIATINGSGLATGVSPGTATITGTFSGVSGSTSLTVAAAASNVKLIVSGTASKLDVTFLQSGERFIFSANALDDTISTSRIDTRSGADLPLAGVSVLPARGPVWLALDPAGRFLFVANHGSSDISVFAIDSENGRLSPVVGSPFAVEGGAWSVRVSADGQFLLVTHLNAAAVARLRITGANGTLTPEP